MLPASQVLLHLQHIKLPQEIGEIILGAQQEQLGAVLTGVLPMVFLGFGKDLPGLLDLLLQRCYLVGHGWSHQGKDFFTSPRSHHSRGLPQYPLPQFILYRHSSADFSKTDSVSLPEYSTG